MRPFRGLNFLNHTRRLVHANKFPLLSTLAVFLGRRDFHVNNIQLNMITKRSKVTLPNLPYDYKDLEPIVSREIMQLHHQKHHAAYVNNYNIAEEKLQTADSKGSTSFTIASSHYSQV